MEIPKLFSFLISFGSQIEIWEERRVFGSRGQGLKDAVLGDAPPALDNNGKSTNPIKIVRKDANTIRIVSTRVSYCIFLSLFLFTGSSDL